MPNGVPSGREMLAPVYNCIVQQPADTGVVPAAAIDTPAKTSAGAQMHSTLQTIQTKVPHRPTSKQTDNVLKPQTHSLGPKATASKQTHHACMHTKPKHFPLQQWLLHTAAQQTELCVCSA
jgi:hypothetical protein